LKTEGFIQKSTYNHETHVSTQQPKKEKQARLSEAQQQQKRKKGVETPSQERASPHIRER